MFHEFFICDIGLSEKGEQLLEVLESEFCFCLSTKQILQFDEFSFNRLGLLCHYSCIIKKRILN